MCIAASYRHNNDRTVKYMQLFNSEYSRKHQMSYILKVFKISCVHVTTELIPFQQPWHQ